MFRKNKFQNAEIQVCKCGGIHMCFGNVTVHMEKNEFLAMANKVEKTKHDLNRNLQKEVVNVSHEIH